MEKPPAGATHGIQEHLERRLCNLVLAPLKLRGCKEKP